MMINPRLIAQLGESRRYIAAHVALQWCSLLANILLMFAIAGLVEKLYLGRAESTTIFFALLAGVGAVLVRYLCITGASQMSWLSSKSVKQTLRTLIYEKLLKLGASYRQKVMTSEVVQVAVEGVDQLETYFGAYLPQFFTACWRP